MMPEPSGPRGGSGDIGSPVWPGGVTMTILLPRNRYTGKENTPGQTASGSGRGSVRCWLLALLGPAPVRIQAAAPVVPGFVASLAGPDDAPS